MSMEWRPHVHVHVHVLVHVLAGDHALPCLALRQSAWDVLPTAMKQRRILPSAFAVGRPLISQP